MKHVVIERWVRFPPETWISVLCESYVLSGTGFCDGPIPLPEKSNQVCVCVCVCVTKCYQVQRELYTPTVSRYRGADKSLARPGRKQARKHVRDARDFNNIETRLSSSFFFFARHGADANSRHYERNISLFPFWSG